MDTVFRAKLLNNKYMIVYPVFKHNRYFAAWMMPKDFFTKADEKVVSNLCMYAQMLSELGESGALRKEFLGPMEVLAESTVMASCIQAGMSSVEFIHTANSIAFIRINGDYGTMEVASRCVMSADMAKEFYTSFETPKDFFDYLKAIDVDTDEE